MGDAGGVPGWDVPQQPPDLNPTALSRSWSNFLQWIKPKLLFHAQILETLSVEKQTNSNNLSIHSEFTMWGLWIKHVNCDEFCSCGIF